MTWLWRRLLSRSAHRFAHVSLASLLGVALYSPVGSDPAVETFVRLVVFPALSLSGLLLWKGGALRRRVRTHAAGGSSD